MWCRVVTKWRGASIRGAGCMRCGVYEVRVWSVRGVGARCERCRCGA